MCTYPLAVSSVDDPRTSQGYGCCCERSLVDGELLAQGGTLEGELTTAADEEGKESKQVR
jgi:hypothetical protein